MVKLEDLNIGDVVEVSINKFPSGSILYKDFLAEIVAIKTELDFPLKGFDLLVLVYTLGEPSEICNIAFGFNQKLNIPKYKLLQHDFYVISPSEITSVTNQKW